MGITRHKAFANWWRSKANDTETMEEYLFSGPVVATKVMLVGDTEAAKQSADDASSLLINIPQKPNLQANRQSFGQHISQRTII